MNFKLFLENIELYEDFSLFENKIYEENTPYPLPNLMEYANTILGLKVTDSSLTVPVRQRRTDKHNQLIVQANGHFFNRIQKRDLPETLIWDKLKRFLDNHLKELAASYKTSSHIEGIIRINLMKAVKDERGKYQNLLNIPYRYSTFKEPSPSKHALTFITIMANNHFVQNAPPKHSDTIVKDVRF